MYNRESARVIYSTVARKYESGISTQQEIAQQLGIPLKAVQSITKNLGFHHTKAKNGINPIVWNDYLDNELVPLLN